MIRALALAMCLIPGVADAAVTGRSLDPSKALTQYVIKTYDQDNGLPQNTIEALLQTSEGYLWIGTDEGLVRFDGHTFDVFDQQSYPVFAESQTILALAEDAAGRLWVGTDGGGLIRVEGDVFRLEPLTGLSATARVSSIEQTQDGAMLLVDSYRGVYLCLDSACIRQEVEASLYQSAVQGDDGRVWIATDAGLFSGQPGGPYQRVADSTLATAAIQTIFVDRSGTLWVAPEAGGLFRGGERGFERMPEALNWPAETVWAISEDRAGTLWIGLGGDGLIRARNTLVERLMPEQGLPAGRIQSILEDREGSLWVGTMGGGVARLRDGALTTFSEAEGLAGDQTYSVFEDRNGVVWVGSLGQGASRIDNGTIDTVDRSDGLSSLDVTAIAGTPDGSVWLGTLDAGLNRFQDGRVRAFVRGLPSASVYGLFTDTSGDLWVGTDAGVAVVRNGRVTATYTTANGLSGNSISAMAEAPDGSMWIGTYSQGLSRISGDAVEQYAPVEMDGMDRILALHIDADGHLWIGSDGSGLAVFHDGVFSRLKVGDGLFDNKIFQILEDDEGRFWMGSNHGIFAVQRQDLLDRIADKRDDIPFEQFTQAHGMKSREVNAGVQPAGWRARDGRLWFPTTRGVVVLDPQDMRRSTPPPPLLIEELRVDGARMSLSGLSPLAPSSHRVEFRFAALALAEGNLIRYRYRLLGDRNEWTARSRDGIASFTNLKPGEYELEVEASTVGRDWEPQTASLSFSIRPRFYQTGLFWLFAILVGAGLLWGTHRFRVRQMTYQQRLLERMVDARTRDVTAAKNRIEEQSAALRNSLREKDVLLREIHHRVKNNLQMISSLLQLQAKQVPDPKTRVLFHECRDRIYSISMVHERLYRSQDLSQMDFGRYLRDITEQLARLHDSEDRHVRVSVETGQVELGVDRAIPCGLIITELVSNAITHGFKPGSTGDVSVTLERHGDEVLLAVEDSGVGLPQDYRERQRKSLGLNLVSSLVRRIQGRMDVHNSEFGARFEIRFPIEEPAGGDALTIEPENSELSALKA